MQRAGMLRAGSTWRPVGAVDIAGGSGGGSAVALIVAALSAPVVGALRIPVVGALRISVVGALSGPVAVARG
jgi:hypothetical protein